MSYHISPVLDEATNGVLNETTNTVYTHRSGAPEFETECGLIRIMVTVYR